MKTPKQKALDLIDKMFNTENCGIDHFPNKHYCECSEMSMFQAKQCALVAVDEIMDSLDGTEPVEDYANKNFIYYWKEVQQEIKNL